jgi:hypothetical protein
MYTFFVMIAHMSVAMATDIVLSVDSSNMVF